MQIQPPPLATKIHANMTITTNTPKNLDEILALEDIGQKITFLKKGRRTPEPNTTELLDDWEPSRHDIMDEKKVGRVKVLSKLPWDEFNEKTGQSVHHEAEYTEKDPNRIALPIEQDIVNIQTAFTVGTEPKLNCEPEESEKGVLEALRKVLKGNKMKYQNRKEVRSWLSETEVAEYWYAVEDDGFWRKIFVKVAALAGVKVQPKKRLKCAIWSPFRGDKLYPFFDEQGDMVAFSREYERKDLNGVKHTVFMTITATNIYQWETLDGWVVNEAGTFEHKFSKLPVLYCQRDKAYCANIRTVRNRIEKCLSGYADCIDNHFFPKLLLFGELENIFSGDPRNQILQMMGDGVNAKYLTWNQSADPVKVEIETYFNQAYALTNTPRISFDQIKGTSTLSGVAFRYVFMAAFMAVENHGEVLGEFFQRRVNFLLSALGDINASFAEAAKTIDVEVEIVPYLIDSDKDKVETAVAAVSGGVWTTEAGVAYCNNYGELKDQVEQVKEEQREKNSNVSGNS